MPTVADVLDALEIIAPSRYAFGFDKIGLQVGDVTAKVTKGVVSLDRSLAAVQYAASLGAELLVSHHPLLFEPAKTVTAHTHVGRTIQALIKNDISFIAAHTNWDCAKGGVNDELAARLGLTAVQDFGFGTEVHQLKVVVFLPPSDLEGVLDAAASVGAGEVGLYSRCGFYAPGTGTYIGGEGSNPTVGQPGRVERAQELRLEMVLPRDRREAVDVAIRRAHSYEEPALEFFPLAPLEEQAAGRIGRVPPVTLHAFRAHVARTLNEQVLAWGDPNRRIEKIALVGGAADSEWTTAQRFGADVFLTGEVRQHIALEAVEQGFAIMAAGHYATEQPGVEALAERLGEAQPDIEWQVFTPEPGQAGRPL